MNLFKLLFRSCFILLLFLASCGINANNNSEGKISDTRPNIIYILVDDMGYGDIGCFGQKEIPTPKLDQMAAEGIRFTRHYAGSTVCAPSRCALITGRHTGHARVRGNYETGPFGFGGELELRPEDVSIAEVLNRTGYRTAMIGKWGLGMNGTTGEPSAKGFDYYYGFLNQAHAHWQFPAYLFRNGVKEPIPGNENGQQNAYTNDIFTAEALSFIQKSAEQAFFLYLAYTTPHAELLVPEDSLFSHFVGKFEEQAFVANGQGGNKEGFGRYGSQTHPKAAYATMISRIDLDVQRILDQLKTLGLDQETLVMFSSDNGPHKEGGAHPTYFDSNGPLRGMKRDLYEGGIRVPFIARWPGKIPAGQVSEHISAFWDVLPTLADVAGVEINNLSLDGKSFYPTLIGKPQQQDQHDYLYWEFHESRFTRQAVNKGDWKAVRHDPDAEPELYHLGRDPGESTNLADQYPDTLNLLVNLMEGSRSPHKIWPLKRSGNTKDK